MSETCPATYRLLNVCTENATRLLCVSDKVTTSVALFINNKSTLLCTEEAATVKHVKSI